MSFPCTRKRAVSPQKTRTRCEKGWQEGGYQAIFKGKHPAPKNLKTKQQFVQLHPTLTSSHPTPTPHSSTTQKKWLVVRTRAITIISPDLQVRCVFDVKTTGFGYETLRKARRTATRWQVCNGNEHDRCDVATGCWPQLEGRAIDLDLLRPTCMSL